MPTYIYKAVNREGYVVRNRVESGSKRMLVRLLKQNEFTPIEIQQISARKLSTKRNKKRKNISQLQEIMENVNNTSIVRQKTESSIKEKINKYFVGTTKITKRDLVIFTQNFYLLKKANFNNIINNNKKYGKLYI